MGIKQDPITTYNDTTYKHVCELVTQNPTQIPVDGLERFRESLLNRGFTLIQIGLIIEAGLEASIKLQ
jgi:hypothetical protein